MSFNQKCDQCQKSSEMNFSDIIAIAKIYSDALQNLPKGRATQSAPNFCSRECRLLYLDKIELQPGEKIDLTDNVPEKTE